jgi:hypothetical protein
MRAAPSRQQSDGLGAIAPSPGVSHAQLLVRAAAGAKPPSVACRGSLLAEKVSCGYQRPQSLLGAGRPRACRSDAVAILWLHPRAWGRPRTDDPLSWNAATDRAGGSAAANTARRRLVEPGPTVAGITSEHLVPANAAGKCAGPLISRAVVGIIARTAPGGSAASRRRRLTGTSRPAGGVQA